MKKKRTDIFYINGYWKDDNIEFTDYKVTEFDDVRLDDKNDNSIFFYGLSESEIIDAIQKKRDTIHEFVITSYSK